MMHHLKERIKDWGGVYVALVTIRAYTLYFINRITGYRLEKDRFYRNMHYPLNLKNPQTYNEKIMWKKIYDRNPLIQVTADKYLVRFYIQEILGEKVANKILIPLFHVTDQPEKIPFEKLSDSFILKPNHSSGLQIIVDHHPYDPRQLIKTCRRWLQTPYGLEKMEWAYQSIHRRIIVEKLLREKDGSPPKDYKLHMFHGKCKLINVNFDRVHKESNRSFFDENWNHLLIRKSSNPQGMKIDPPENYEIMLSYAEKLAEPFDYIRVDFYNMNGNIYIGELTHYPTGGMGEFEPASFDLELGKNWKLKQDYWKEHQYLIKKIKKRYEEELYSLNDLYLNK